jgi:hypothetical protein
VRCRSGQRKRRQRRALPATVQRQRQFWIGNGGGLARGRGIGAATAAVLNRERSEASCQACGCKSRRCKSPCGTVAISGNFRFTGGWKPGRKSPRRPDGHRTVSVGSVQGANEQERAVAKANGRIAEVEPRTKLIQAEYWSAKTLFPVVNGQRRCGRHGEMHAPDSRRKLHRCGTGAGACWAGTGGGPVRGRAGRPESASARLQDSVCQCRPTWARRRDGTFGRFHSCRYGFLAR